MITAGPSLCQCACRGFAVREGALSVGHDHHPPSSGPAVLGHHARGGGLRHGRIGGRRRCSSCAARGGRCGRGNGGRGRGRRNSGRGRGRRRGSGGCGGHSRRRRGGRGRGCRRGGRGRGGRRAGHGCGTCRRAHNGREADREIRHLEPARSTGSAPCPALDLELLPAVERSIALWCAAGMGRRGVQERAALAAQVDDDAGAACPYPAPPTLPLPLPSP